MKIPDIEKWAVEVDLAEDFRDKEFGSLSENEKTLAGENIDYYERGYSDKVLNELGQGVDLITTLNIVDAIVSIIVPTLYYKNPRTVAIPKKIESQVSAPLAGKIIDHYRKELEVDDVNQKVIWDAYVLGMGVYKIGYATKFGTDIPDEAAQKEREKQRKTLIDRAMEAIGLKKKKEEEVIRPETDLRIVAENPFIQYVNPFDFFIDPRATSINDARWVAQRLRKTLKDIKANPKYKEAKRDLQGTLPDIRTLNTNKVTESELDDFKTTDIFEIHYRNEDKFYLLVLARDDNGRVTELYHEKSAYDLGEFQFDILTFKKHGHALYPRSDITKLKMLQDRITTTIDAVLEQVDKFVPKIAVEMTALTPEGQNSLEFGGVGAIVECNKSPGEAIKEINFTQLKADLQKLIDQLIQLISIQTGITGAQLTGATNANTATEITVEQGGQNIRLSDMAGSVQKFVNRQSRKLWKIVTQFVSLEDLELINGIQGVDEQTGLPKYNWLTMDYKDAEKVAQGNYDFDIEVGSTQKVDLAVVRKAFENMFNILARKDVIALMQQQGKKVDLAELLRKYIELFPEMGLDTGKVIQQITQQTTGLVDLAVAQGRGGMTQGSTNNAMAAQMAEQVPSMPKQMAEVY